MKKLYLIIIGVLILGAIYGLFMMDYAKPVGVENGGGAVDPFNAIYLIDGRAVKLTDKYFESEIAPNSASKMKVLVFGEPVYGDLDNDGDEDVLLILTVDMGGSGTFYYGVVALNYPDGWRGTNAVLMGDRIAPQTNQIINNLAIVNYAIRGEGEPISGSPSIGKSDYLYIQGGSLEQANLKNSNIFLIRPQENYTIHSPVEISGYARGNWFFEASFPVILTDWDGKIIAEGIATAENEWMTTNFVPFKAVLNFDSPYKDGDQAFMRNGILILKKDNPSDLPENDDALETWVLF